MHAYIHAYIHIYIQICMHICMYVFKTEKNNNFMWRFIYFGYSPLKDLNARPLYFIQLSGHEISTHSEPTSYSYSNLFFCL